jgi:hypothetical protein
MQQHFVTLWHLFQGRDFDDFHGFKGSAKALE